MLTKLYRTLKSKLKRQRSLKYCSIGNATDLRSSFSVLSQHGFISIGEWCNLNCHIYCIGGRLIIGNNTWIGNSELMAADSISIGNNVIISDDVLIQDNNNHPTSMRERQKMSLSHDYFGPLWKWDKSASSPIVIEDNVWIGKRAVILKGVHIGEGSIVALGSIVTKDVPSHTIVAGNPARVVKELTD